MIKSATKAIERTENSASEAAAPPLLRIDADNRSSNCLCNFHDLEHFAGHTFQWSHPVAMIRLMLQPDDYLIRINTGEIRGHAAQLPLDLYWNDESIADAAISADRREISFRVSRSQCVAGGEQSLLLITEPLTVAAPERRLLGLPLVSLEVLRGSSDTEAMRRAKAGGASQRMHSSSNPRPTQLPDWTLKGIRKLIMPKVIPAPASAVPGTTSTAARRATPSKPESRSTPVACESAIVCPNELNARHGTGIVLKNMFPRLDQMAVLESMRCYDRERFPTAVTWELPPQLSRSEVYRCVLDWFTHAPPKQAYVVPYFPSDALMALALKDLFCTPLVLHVMDDNTLINRGIPSKLMEELIVKADVRFAISPEMRTAYQQQFGHKFYLLPPLVDAKLVGLPHDSSTPSTDRGAMIGNVWSPQWLKKLAATVADSGLQIDWFCSNRNHHWVVESLDLLTRSGITVYDTPAGDELVSELRRRPFLVLPTGEPTDTSAQAIAKLSLPSRAVFQATTVQTPMLVLGNRETAVAKFVDQFALGTAVPYEGRAFREAAVQLSDPHMAQRVRTACSEIAPVFSAAGMDDWIWTSMKQRQPADDRFERLFPANDGLAGYVTAEPPSTLHWGQHGVWEMLSRYKNRGIDPQTIIDVGASTGCWSQMASLHFPQSHFVLCEPLFHRYPEPARKYYLKQLASHEVVDKVVTNYCGATTLTVSESLYGSSLLAVTDVHGATNEVQAECIKLDALDEQRQWRGPILLKADVQFAEHLVIEGAAHLLQTKIDAVILELSFTREHAQAKTYGEMVEMMSTLGFDVYDESSGWRHHRTGQLEQKDVLFVRRS